MNLLSNFNSIFSSILSNGQWTSHNYSNIDTLFLIIFRSFENVRTRMKSIMKNTLLSLQFNLIESVPSVRPVPWHFFSETALTIFLKFGMKFRYQNWRNVTWTDFLFSISKRLKSPFLAQKWGFLDFVKNLLLTFFFIFFLKIYKKVLDNLVALVLTYIPWCAWNFASKSDFGAFSIIIGVRDRLVRI